MFSKLLFWNRAEENIRADTFIFVFICLNSVVIFISIENQMHKKRKNDELIEISLSLCASLCICISKSVFVFQFHSFSLWHYNSRLLNWTTHNDIVFECAFASMHSMWKLINAVKCRRSIQWDSNCVLHCSDLCVRVSVYACVESNEIYGMHKSWERDMDDTIQPKLNIYFYYSIFDCVVYVVNVALSS